MSIDFLPVELSLDLLLHRALHQAEVTYPATQEGIQFYITYVQNNSLTRGNSFGVFAYIDVFKLK